MIKLFCLALFLFLLFHGAQTRTRYQALPCVTRPRLWGVQGRRWAVVVVRLA